MMDKQGPYAVSGLGRHSDLDAGIRWPEMALHPCVWIPYILCTE